jgi:hypothetical protein
MYSRVSVCPPVSLSTHRIVNSPSASTIAIKGKQREAYSGRLLQSVAVYESCCQLTHLISGGKLWTPVSTDTYHESNLALYKRELLERMAWDGFVSVWSRFLFCNIYSQHAFAHVSALLQQNQMNEGMPRLWPKEME